MPAHRHAPSPAAHRRQEGEIISTGPGNRLQSRHEQCSHVSAPPVGLCTALDKLSYSFWAPPCGASASFSAGYIPANRMQFPMKIEERYTFILFFPTRLLRRFGAVPVTPMMSLVKGGSAAPEMRVLQSQDVLASLLRQTLSALS